MTDFRADLGDVLKGKDGKDVIRTLKSLVKAEGRKTVDCERCGKRSTVQVMDAKTVLEAVKWITDQTQGKPAQATTSAPSGKPLTEMTDEELAVAAGMTDKDWIAWQEWVTTRKGNP